MARLAIALEVVGAAAVISGVWLVYPPAAVIVAGLAAAFIAQGLERG